MAIRDLVSEISQAMPGVPVRQYHTAFTAPVPTRGFCDCRGDQRRRRRGGAAACFRATGLRRRAPPAGFGARLAVGEEAPGCLGERCSLAPYRRTSCAATPARHVERIEEEARAEIVAAIAQALADVRVCVADWRSMLNRVSEVIAGLKTDPPPL
jgi:hypothetical protein